MKIRHTLAVTLLMLSAWTASYSEATPKTVPGNVRINDMVLTDDLLKQLVKKKVTLQMKVASAGATKKGDLMFLNSAGDFRSAGNFTVVLNKKAQKSLAKADIAKPRSHFAGKTIRVVGTLTLYNGRPQIMVSDAAQIKVSAQEEPIFAPGAKLKVEAEGEGGGEGPAWHPKLGVFSSGDDNNLYLLGRDGKQKIYRKKAGTNGLLFDRKGNLVSCDSVARRVSRTDLKTGKTMILTEKYQGRRYNNPNDLTIDSRGRIYFSDPRYGKRDGMEIRDDKGRIIEGVYRIDPDNKVTRIIGRELERPNGVLVSADDRWLFVGDNNNDAPGTARKLWRFDLKKDGTVDFASKKLLYDWGNGRGPDGIKQDRQGRLYVAAGRNKPNKAEPDKDKKGGIYVFTPAGKLLTFLAVPRDEVTNCAFGGDDLKTLFITGGGTLYSIRTTTPGRVVWPDTSRKR